MDCRERGSHARGVYPTQYTSRMITARVKEEEGADKHNSKIAVLNMEGRNVGTIGGRKSQTRPN